MLKCQDGRNHFRKSGLKGRGGCGLGGVYGERGEGEGGGEGVQLSPTLDSKFHFLGKIWIHLLIWDTVFTPNIHTLTLLLYTSLQQTQFTTTCRCMQNCCSAASDFGLHCLLRPVRIGRVRRVILIPPSPTPSEIILDPPMKGVNLP